MTSWTNSICTEQLALEKIAIGEADSVSDPELLMSIMETREALEDASTEDEVAEIREENQGSHFWLFLFYQYRLTHVRLGSGRVANIDETLTRLTAAFGSSPPDLETAKNLVVQLRYLENVEGVCREWQPGGRIELHH